MSTALNAFMRGIFGSLFGALARTATANGAAIDMVDYEGIAVVTLDSAAGTGTTPTNTVKLQDSPDNVTFTDIPGAAFTQLTTVASVQQLQIDTGTVARFVRAVTTIGGTTPSYTFSVGIVGQKKYQS